MTDWQWQALGQAFENIGAELWVECENTEELCKSRPEFAVLYHHYAALLNLVNQQRTLLHLLFDAIDGGGLDGSD